MERKRETGLSYFRAIHFILITIFVLCCLITPTVYADKSGLGKPEITIEDGVPIPQSVRPVIILSGSDFDLGYQYFQQLVQIYGPWVPSQRWSIQGPWKFKDIHQEKYNEEEQAALKAWEDNIRKHAPEWIDILKGMAAGAKDAGVNITYDDLIKHYALFYEQDLGYWAPTRWIYPGTEPKTSKEGEQSNIGCSGFAAWGGATKDGKLIACGIEDSSEAFFSSTVIVFPQSGNSFIISPYNVVGLGGVPDHPGMNSKGLAWVHHGGAAAAGEKWGYTVPRGMQVLHTLRFANNTKEALEMHLSYPKVAHHISSAFFADVSGDVLVCESREPKLIRRAGDSGEREFLYAANNRLHPDMGAKGETNVLHGGWFGRDTSSITRNLQMWNLAHNYHGKIDLEFVKMMTRQSLGSPDYPSIEEAEAAYGKAKGAGWYRAIGSLSNGMVGIMIPEEKVYYVSNFATGRGAEPSSPGGHNYPPAKTYSFYQLKLAATPEKVVEAAYERATYDLYYANKELRKLNYRDHGYAELDAIYNRAATEYYKGQFHSGHVTSGKTKGHDSVYALSTALRCFARSQAYARQVYETLVPPATSPEDLGLGKMYGNWGEWAMPSVPKSN
jgi:hypothetical protein